MPHLTWTNPLVEYPHTDPSAHVFQGRLYVYGGSDAFEDPEWAKREHLTWDLHMQNYHVFSTDDLQQWTDHGEILRVADIPWVKSHLWAPDCAERNGKYYFVFPALPKNDGPDFTGVAIADHPAGPFVPHPTPIAGAHGGEPCIFAAPDGHHYLYLKAHGPRWGDRPTLVVARMNDDMLSLAEPLREVDILDQPQIYTFFEGPWVHYHNGLYYLSYPAIVKGSGWAPEHLAYAVSDSIYGPFRFVDVLLPHEPGNHDFTDHGSIVQFRDEWLLFHHRQVLPDAPGGIEAALPGRGRRMCCKRLVYQPDGRLRLGDQPPEPQTPLRR